jgi:hypothetical protein
MWNGVIMFANNPRWRHGLAAWAALALSASAWALEPGAPVKIEFLPPPMDGTISLGIYDEAGKLVRVLQREAEIADFTAADNGLVTPWDGKDDHGATCPTGTYHARGVTVGELSVEGVDFIGNDWVVDDNSPRIRRITGLGTNPDGYPVIATTVAGQSKPVVYLITRTPGAPNDTGDFTLKVQPQMPHPVITVRDGKIEGVTIPGLKETVTDAALGEDGFVLAIIGNTVKKFSKKGDLVRTLDPKLGDPPPVKVAAAPNRKTFYVLYEDARLQRLRGYDILPFSVAKGPSAEGPRDRGLMFKELFENDIFLSDRYEQIAAQLKFPDDKPFVPAPVVTVTLVANPLSNNKPGTLQIRADVDKEGSYLATTDGLPLCHISGSKDQLWAVIGQAPGSKALTLFNSDGAVVEEFKIANPANMMAFDAGAIQWTAPLPAVSPTATPAASPTVPIATPAPTATPAVSTGTPVPSATP